MTTTDRPEPAAQPAPSVPQAPRPLAALLGGVSGERVAATVATLAGAPFSGRRFGSAGGAAARAWLAQRLADLGATITTQPFTVRSVPEVYTTPSVKWHDGAGLHRLTFARDVVVHLASADEALARRGDLAVAGAGDPTGRWLVVPAGMTLFDAYGHAHRAAGLLFGRGVDADGWLYTMRTGPNPGPLPILTLDTATHAALLAAAGTGGSWLAATTPIHRLDVPAVNLHGTWGGGTGVQVLLTAHYDGVGDHPGPLRPAAAGNGGGVAVVLEAARVLAHHLPGGARLSVAFLDAGQAGALGAAHHATQLRRAGAAPLVINVDGAGNLDRAAAVEAGGAAHGLLAALDQAGRYTGLPLVAGAVASDNRRYAAAGFAAVGVGALQDEPAVVPGAGDAGIHGPAGAPDLARTATLGAVARLVVATCWLATVDPATLQAPS